MDTTRRQALTVRLESAKADLAKARAAAAYCREQADTNHALADEQECLQNVAHYNHVALGYRLKAIAGESECRDLAGRVGLLETMLADPEAPGAVALDPVGVAAMDETAGVAA